MKFEISKSNFYEALQDCSLAITPNSPLPALNGIKILVKQDEVELTASDGDISIQKVLSVKDDENLHLIIEEEGCVVIESKYILDMIKNMDSDIVHIEIIDGALTSFKGDNAQYRINGMRAEDYPSIDFSKPVNEITIPASTLSDIIDETGFAVSAKENRAVLRGIHFQLHDNRLECSATDSYRLAKKSIDFNSSLNLSFTIPLSSLTKARSIFFKDTNEDITMYQNDKKIQFSKGRNILQSRLLEGNFPDTNRLMPRAEDLTRKLTIKRSSFINVLERSLFIKTDNQIVNRLQCSDEDIIFSNRSQEIGDFKESLAVTGAKYEGEPLDISFNGYYLYQAVKALKGENVCIQFCGQMKPFIAVNPDDDSLIQLALPVRTYN